ncbi:hypothetical protein GFB49_02520 [Epibacterium sp. SM1979]|uniref:Lipoprotein n=1 Tax=Tritonibacter litoralis TaxID=2662264 RepID=A0A843Y800_9RHOB|nr:hypothetical protein [Tritonibacter litoralis]MQQ07320.1 hypothetical protein [Tritonibacter litoralis]
MQKSIAVLLTGALILSSCGSFRDSRVNPRNWFGRSDEVRREVEAETTNPLIPIDDKVSLTRKEKEDDTRVLLDSVTELRVDPTPTGAIIHATGLPTRQGAFDVILRPNEDADEGVLELEFLVNYPEFATVQGSEFSRSVRAAYSVSNFDLRDIRLIRVVSTNNARETRRR